MTTKIKAVDNTSQQAWQHELEAWVFSGILWFWRRALPVDGGVYALMHDRVCQILGSIDAAEWPQENARWQDLVQKDNHKKTNEKKANDKNASYSSFPLQPFPLPQFPLLQLAQDYQLSPAQLFTLSLVGMVETSHWVNLALAELQAPDKAPRPSVHLLCALLDDLFDDAQQPSALDITEQPLIKMRVLDLVGDVPLPLQRVQVHPQLWSILLGRTSVWPQCQMQPLSLAQDGLLSPSVLAQIPALGDLLSQPNSAFEGVLVRGNPNAGRGLFSQRLAAALDLTAINTPLEVWRDQAAFVHACRYARWLPVVRPSLAPADSLSLTQHKTPLKVPVVVILGSDGALEGKMLEIQFETPSQAERLICWQQTLGHEFADLGEQVSASALLSAQSIQGIAEHALQLAKGQQQKLALTHIAEARRKWGVDKLRLLAQPIAREVTAKALVLPETVEQALEAVVLRACHREALWANLGDTLKATPNPGVRVLFVGESGTGKTLAASYIATRLGAPLYRVDLSAVMNKYIGESEKNLSQLLDQAAAKDVVLLFDEADALFGKRGEGQENGERFANMLTNFLLTRIETHPGIVILTTNSRERIDPAFSRRLDIIVEFPLPGFEERLHLWRSHLGERGPGEAVYRHLASTCDLAGGQLRNVVLTAAVYAQGETISNAHLVEGLRAEYRKQGRDFPKKLETLPGEILISVPLMSDLREQAQTL